MTGTPPHSHLILGRAFFQCSRPFRVGRVLGHVAVQIRRAVVPPDGAALSQCDLGGIDAFAGEPKVSASTLGILDGSPSLHELGDEVMTTFFRDGRVRGSPQAARDDEVAAVWRRGVRA